MRCGRWAVGLVLVAVMPLAAQFGGNASKLKGKPPCSATVTTNCVPTADAAGNVVVGAALLLPVTKVTDASTNAALGTRYLCDRAGCTFVLPAATTATRGGSVCVRNYTARAGSIVFQLPVSPAHAIDVDGTAYSATVTSSAEAGAAACVQVTAAGEYFFFGGKGTWSGGN